MHLAEGQGGGHSEAMNDASVRSRRPRSSASERAQWAQRFLQSGLSQREFALQQGLRLCTLQRWVAQHPAPAPSFAEVKLPALAGPARGDWAAELVRPDGSTLRLAHAVSAGLVRQLLRAC